MLHLLVVKLNCARFLYDFVFPVEGQLGKEHKQECGIKKSACVLENFELIVLIVFHAELHDGLV